MKSIKLAKSTMPQLGLGTWRSEPGKVKAAVDVALRIGVKHIDCAWIYGNEAEVGQSLSSALSTGLVKREDLFVTTKLWNTYHSPKHVRAACEESLRSLQLDYVDLYLMHWPVAFEFQSHDIKTPKRDGKVAIDETLTEDQSTTWTEMEALVDAGLVRDIGVSNFCPERLDKLLKTAKITPAVNQVELHPYNAQPELLKYCASKNIHLTAYSPLGSEGSDLLSDPTVSKIAEAHNVDVGSILIAWGLARGTSVIPKSVNPKRVESNFAAKDVSLSKDEIAQIDGLGKSKRFVDPSTAWGVDIYCQKKANL